MQLLCEICEKEKPIVKRPKNGNAVCRQCFYFCFEEEIHETITRGKLFRRNDRVAVASSGGKDSTVLGYVLKLLNERYDYGLELVLLSIDEGITGYRDDSLESVKRNQKDYGLPLTILSYKDIYGWTMDDIVKQIGLKSNCTFCGVFRRQALDRGAMELNCDSIVTGHNADDLAETILMNVLRGDIARLKRSCFISTGSERPTGNERSSKDASISEDKDANGKRADNRVSNEFAGPNNQDDFQDNLNANQTERPAECCGGRLVTDRTAEAGTAADDCCGRGQCLSNTIFKSPIGLLPRSKPFKYTYEKEIVMYAHFKKLDYFSTECIYSPNSYRGHARAFLKELEVIRPSVIIDIIHSGESVLVRDTLTLPQRGTCVRCGYISSQNICKACVMLEGLNKGQPRLGIGKSSKVELIKQVNRRMLCRQAGCEKADCDGRSHRPVSKKQLKKRERLNKRDESTDVGLKIEQDVSRFMDGLSLTGGSIDDKTTTSRTAEDDM